MTTGFWRAKGCFRLATHLLSIVSRWQSQLKAKTCSKNGLHHLYCTVLERLILAYGQNSREEALDRDVVGTDPLAERLRYGLDDRGTVLRFLARTRDVSRVQRVQTISGAHPALLWTGTAVSSPRIQGSEGGSTHLRPYSSEVKNTWSHNLHCLIRIHGVQSGKFCPL